MYYKNQWIVAASADAMRQSPEACAISRALGVTLPTAQLLVNRGCRTPEEATSFLEKAEEQLHDPFLMRDMDKAVARITEAIENGEKIVIYGDYDVDGVTSVTSLYLYLKAHGGDVGYYIPCRSGEGYGLSDGAIRKLAEGGCRLIVTVDTGITALDEAKLVRELGLSLVVTDHHECHDGLPEADAVINPRRPGCPYPFKELAGVGVVFKLLCALETVLHPNDPLIDCVRRISHDYGDLVAIGTVADVMPVRDENRLIVSYGLTLIEQSMRPGLLELIDATRGESKYNTKRKITASFIGYTIAPRINAAGRIRDASLAVDLFLSTDHETAAPIAKQLCDINKERQVEENKIIEEAYAKIAAYHDFEHDPVIVLDDETWHHGVIGIVASRITEKYNCPSILISFEGSGEGENGSDFGKGSGRSIKGLNLADTLAECSDLLEKYGGHELAAGLTIKRENLPAFRKRINELARQSLSDTERQTQLEAECELTENDITMEQAKELYQLEPFGVSNPVPVFVLRNVPVYDTALVGGGKHTRLTLKIDQRYVSAMCFRQTLTELDVYPGDLVDVMFTLDINEFQNQQSVQMIVKDVRLAEKRYAAECRERELYQKIRDGACAADLGLTAEEGRFIVPTREDFAEVYSVLRRELRVEHEVFNMRALQHLVRSAGGDVNYIKMSFILEIFRELSLLGVELVDPEYETYAFRYIPATQKTDLERSALYRKLKADFGQRI